MSKQNVASVHGKVHAASYIDPHGPRSRAKCGTNLGRYAIPTDQPVNCSKCGAEATEAEALQAEVVVMDDEPASAAYVVCSECGARWTVSYQKGRTSPPQPRICQNRECDAGWLDLSMFWERADADRAAERAEPSLIASFAAAIEADQAFDAECRAR